MVFLFLLRLLSKLNIYCKIERTKKQLHIKIRDTITSQLEASVIQSKPRPPEHFSRFRWRLISSSSMSLATRASGLGMKEFPLPTP